MAPAQRTALRHFPCATSFFENVQTPARRLSSRRQRTPQPTVTACLIRHRRRLSWPLERGRLKGRPTECSWTCGPPMLMKSTRSSRTAPSRAATAKGADVSPDFRLFFNGVPMGLRPINDSENTLVTPSSPSRECQRAVPDADMQCFSTERRRRWELVTGWHAHPLVVPIERIGQKTLPNKKPYLYVLDLESTTLSSCCRGARGSGPPLVARRKNRSGFGRERSFAAV